MHNVVKFKDKINKVEFSEGATLKSFNIQKINDNSTRALGDTVSLFK